MKALLRSPFSMVLLLISSSAFAAGLFGPVVPENQSAGFECYNKARIALDKAAELKGGAAASGSMAAGSASSATLSTGGVGATGMGAGQSAQAAGQSSACVSAADSAMAKVKKCPDLETTKRDYLVQKINKEFVPAYQDIVSECSQNAAGYSAQAGSLNDTTTALMMMTAMQGLSGAGGSSSGGSSVPAYNFDNDDDDSDDIKTRNTPALTSVGNDRSSASEDESKKPLDIDLGSEEAIKLSDGEEDQDAAKGRGLASTSAKELATPNGVEATAAGALGVGAAAADAQTVASAKAGEEGAAPGFNFDALTGDLAKAEDAPEDAKDAGYLGKKKKKAAESIAAQMARRKKEEAEAKVKAKEAAAARARELASGFHADPKSCAERNWKGKECQALRADPLLQ